MRKNCAQKCVFHGAVFILVVSLIKNCQARDETTCNVPTIKRKNFEYSIEILNGTNRTLSCEIHSDTPLKKEPIWRRSFPTHLPPDHNVKNASCPASTNKTCVISNLTLINVVQEVYDGNYTLTAENGCGNVTVWVNVNIDGE